MLPPVEPTPEPAPEPDATEPEITQDDAPTINDDDTVIENDEDWGDFIRDAENG